MTCDSVKVLRADEKNLVLDLKGTKIPWEWAKLSGEDYGNLARTLFVEEKAESHLLLGVFLFVEGNDEKAEDHFAKAIVMEPKVTRQTVADIRASVRSK